MPTGIIFESWVTDVCFVLAIFISLLSIVMLICVLRLWFKLNRMQDIQQRCISILKTCIIKRTLHPPRFEEYMRRHRFDKSADTEAHSRVKSFRVVGDNSLPNVAGRTVEGGNISNKGCRKYDEIPAASVTVHYASLRRDGDILANQLDEGTYENLPKFQMSTPYPNVKSSKKFIEIPMATFKQKTYEVSALIDSTYTKAQKRDPPVQESCLDEVANSQFEEQPTVVKKPRFAQRKFAQIMDSSASLPSNPNEADSLKEWSVHAQLGSLQSSFSEPIYSQPKKFSGQKDLPMSSLPAGLHLAMNGARGLNQKFHTATKRNAAHSMDSRSSDDLASMGKGPSVGNREANLNRDTHDACDQTDYYEIPWGNSLNIKRIDYNHSIHKLPMRKRNRHSSKVAILSTREHVAASSTDRRSQHEGSQYSLHNSDNHQNPRISAPSSCAVSDTRPDLRSTGARPRERRKYVDTPRIYRPPLQERNSVGLKLNLREPKVAEFGVNHQMAASHKPSSGSQLKTVNRVAEFARSVETIPGTDSLDWDNYQPVLYNAKDKARKEVVVVHINPEIKEFWV